MEATELRIGNLVLFDKEEVVRVEYISSHHVIGLFGKETEHILEKGDVSGIPLTEEWLKRLGLKYQFYSDTYEINFKYDCNKIFVDLFTKHVCIDTGLNSVYIEHIKYVHQLQNLYYALTGEELTIKM